MERSILEKATTLFLSYGFKSITMDDITEALGISKKTLYKHYKNKEKLISVCVDSIQEKIQERIKEVQIQNYNAVKEEFEFERQIMSIFNGNLNKSRLYELKKYYPKIFKKIHCNRREIYESSIKNNLKKGMQEDLYRSDIDTEIIQKLFYTFSITVHSLPESTVKLRRAMIEYHIRSIATEKGIKELEKELEINRKQIIK